MDLASQDTHFWSTDSSEINRIQYDFATHVQEGSVYCPTTALSGTIPVYRFFSSERQHHFWSTDATELANHNSFISEGEKFRVYDPNLPAPFGTRPFIRYNANHQQGDYFNHFWTATPESELLGEWHTEGIIGHVYPDRPTEAAIEKSCTEVFRYRMERALPSWQCRIVDNQGRVQHVGQDIDQATENDARSVCEMQMRDWGRIARQDVSHYSARVTRK